MSIASSNYDTIHAPTSKLLFHKIYGKIEATNNTYHLLNCKSNSRGQASVDVMVTIGELMVETNSNMMRFQVIISKIRNCRFHSSDFRS